MNEQMCDPEFSVAVSNLLHAIVESSAIKRLPQDVLDAAVYLSERWVIHRCNDPEFYEEPNA